MLQKALLAAEIRERDTKRGKDRVYFIYVEYATKDEDQIQSHSGCTEGGLGLFS